MLFISCRKATSLRINLLTPEVELPELSLAACGKGTAYLGPVTHERSPRS
jgi:hypothetical protein